MRFPLPFALPFSAFAASLLMAACGGGGGDSAAPASTAPQDVTLRFAAVAGPGNTAVNCSTTITGLGTTNASAVLADLRFYVTDVQLINDQGTAVPVTLKINATTSDWQQVSGTDNVTLIDLENGQGTCGAGTAATNATVVGTVPQGNYVKVRATVGVPDRMSHSDVMAANPPLNLMDMGWSWQNGRKFMKLELNPIGGVSTPLNGGGTSTVSTYNLHLASTDCTGPGNGTDTCAKKNLAQFTLDFNPATQQIALDVKALFASTDIRTNQNDAVGCMSATTDLDCPNIFTKVGLDIATGGQAGTQSVFRAIPQ